MSNVAAPFGFALRKHPTGQSRATQYAIDAGYTTAIGYGDACLLNTNGTVTLAGATVAILGIFAGCEYTDPTGKPCVSKNWPGTAGCTNIVCYVYDDPSNIFEVQAEAGGSGYVQTVIGAQADLVPGTVNAVTGHSTMALEATIEAAASQGQFRVIGFGPDGVYNASTNAFPTLMVQIAQHQFTVPATAI